MFSAKVNRPHALCYPNRSDIFFFILLLVDRNCFILFYFVFILFGIVCAFWLSDRMMTHKRVGYSQQILVIIKSSTDWKSPHPNATQRYRLSAKCHSHRTEYVIIIYAFTPNQRSICVRGINMWPMPFDTTAIGECERYVPVCIICQHFFFCHFRLPFSHDSFGGGTGDGTKIVCFMQY